MFGSTTLGTHPFAQPNVTSFRLVTLTAGTGAFLVNPNGTDRTSLNSTGGNTTVTGSRRLIARRRRR